MEVLINKNSGVLEVNVTGRIDTNTAPELESAINKELGDLKVVELNLRGVIYISSAGLRVILIFHKALSAHGGKLIVQNANEDVMDIFDMTGFSSFLNIEEKN